MKKYFKDLFRTTSIIAIWIIISVWSLAVFAAITWPNNNPALQPAWWLFQTYFDKIFKKCDDWKVLQWYDPITKSPICVVWGGWKTEVFHVWHNNFNVAWFEATNPRIQVAYDNDNKTKYRKSLWGKTGQQICEEVDPESSCVWVKDVIDSTGLSAASCTDYEDRQNRPENSFHEDVVYCITNGWTSWNNDIWIRTNLTTSRSLNTTYTNNTWHSMMVSAWTLGNTRCAISFTIDGISKIWYSVVNDSIGNAVCNTNVIIPVGSTYSASNDAHTDITLKFWHEMR